VERPGPWTGARPRDGYLEGRVPVPRRQTTTQAPLLLSMSGFGPELARDRGNEAGFHHHLVKPLDMDSLRSLLDARALGTGGARG
jgi:hypothetical protein